MRSRGPHARADMNLVLYEHHAEICKVFSNATRLMILNVLRERELTVAAIADELGLALGTISPHLLMMKQRRVLVSRKEGNRIFYRLTSPKMLQAFDLIRKILLEQIGQETRLLARVESEQVRTSDGHGPRGMGAPGRSVRSARARSG